MKKLILYLAIAQLLGCSETERQSGLYDPILKSESSPKNNTNSKTYSCNFSTGIYTSTFDITSPYLSPSNNSPYQKLEVGIKTAKYGTTAFKVSKWSQASKNAQRQNAICQQLENEFLGYNNSFYTEHNYTEEYSLGSLRQATASFDINDYVSIAPEKAHLTLVYPSINLQAGGDPLRTKLIPLTATCKEPTRVARDYYGDNFSFKHSNNCSLYAENQDYVLDSGETIKLNLHASISPTDTGNRLRLSIDQISFRE